MQVRPSIVCYSQQISKPNKSLQLPESDVIQENFLSPQNKLSQHEQLNFNKSCQSHQLPLNLFYSPGQYNKMLITNGRNLKKREPPLVDGFLQDLQFINDSFFLNCNEKRQERRKKSKFSSSRKKPNNSMTCCDESLNKNTPKKKIQQISNKISNKKVKSKSKKKKIITSKKRISVNCAQQLKVDQQNSSNSYLSQKVVHMNSLIYKSLIKFEQEKREKKLSKLVEKQRKQMKKQLMNNYEDQVRLNNKRLFKRRYQERCKSQLSKSKRSMNYWSSLKDHISEALKEKVQKIEPLKKQFIPCNHKPSISFEEMIYLRKKHERQANDKIKQVEFKKKIQEQRRNEDLKKLQVKRQYLIENCFKKQFKPTAQMIENAFAKQ